jgi:hypothetical protein
MPFSLYPLGRTRLSLLGEGGVRGQGQSRFFLFRSRKGCQGEAGVLTGDGCLLIIGHESWFGREVVRGGKKRARVGPKLWAFWNLFGIEKLERR